MASAQTHTTTTGLVPASKAGIITPTSTANAAARPRMESTPLRPATATTTTRYTRARIPTGRARSKSMKMNGVPALIAAGVYMALTWSPTETNLRDSVGTWIGTTRPLPLPLMTLAHTASLSRLLSALEVAPLVVPALVPAPSVPTPPEPLEPELPVPAPSAPLELAPSAPLELAEPVVP